MTDRDEKFESLPTRGAWIEMITGRRQSRRSFTSLPTRGAWIEISSYPDVMVNREVAPHAGSVD